MRNLDILFMIFIICFYVQTILSLRKTVKVKKETPLIKPVKSNWVDPDLEYRRKRQYKAYRPSNDEIKKMMGMHEDSFDNGTGEDQYERQY